MDKKVSNTNAAVIPGVIGGGIFLFFTFVLNFSLFLSIPIAIAGFGASLLLFSPKKQEVEIIVDGISKEKYDAVIKAGNEKLETLYAFQKKIKNPTVTAKLKEITAVVEKIFIDLKKDPKDIKVARQFLAYYLDTTINILNKYSEISNQNLTGSKIQETLIRVENLLDTIKLAFEKQLEKLLHDDILDLDSELKVLEKTIQLEEGLE